LNNVVRTFPAVQPDFLSLPKGYLFNANGAILISLAAASLRQKFTSADSAIHLRVFFGDYLIRALRSR
jgi:hypothetical protein